MTRDLRPCRCEACKECKRDPYAEAGRCVYNGPYVYVEERTKDE